MKQIGAIATIFDDAGRVLLVHQTYNGCKWAWPGGVVEENESPWDGAVREVREETGLLVEIVRLVTVYHFTDRDTLGFHFLCNAIGGQLHADGQEISEIAFFDPNDLPTPMTKPGRQRLADTLANQRETILRTYDRVEIIE